MSFSAGFQPRPQPPNPSVLYGPRDYVSLDYVSLDYVSLDYVSLDYVIPDDVGCRLVHE